MINFENYKKRVQSASNISYKGKVVKVVGLTIEAQGIKASVGELCTILTLNNEEIKAEVVGFKEDSIILMPLGEIIGIAPGCTITSSGETFSIRCSDDLLGRVIDGIGRPILVLSIGFGGVL